MQIVNYDALARNAKFFHQHIGKNCKLCCVVKNNAYGHGLLKSAQAMLPYASCFAVANVQAFLQIQHLPRDVLVLLPPTLEDVLITANSANCIFSVDSFDTLNTLTNACKLLNAVQIRVHVKIDSGMHRLGFEPCDVNCVIKKLQKNSLKVEGVFSHFWGKTRDQCNEQLQSFLQCAQAFKKAFGNDLCCHIANTNATLLDSKYHLDMVRVGLGLYGYGDQKNLRTAKKVVARVVAIKRANAGDVVGYDAIHVCAKPTTLAVVDVGYANGLPRMMVGSNAKINNQLCTVVAICMGMCILDVKDAKVALDDEVLLLGEGVNPSNNQVIVYELLCNFK